MATQATTLSEALEIYNDRYQAALSNNAKRDIETFKSNTNQINSYYDIVNVAIGENNFTRAQLALDEIVAILNAQGISISEPVTLPLAVGIYPSPAIITVPVDASGLNPDYTNAVSTLFIFQGGINVSSEYTITVTSETNVTAVIQNGNEVKINALTDDNGSVSIQAVKTGFTTLTFTISVFRFYDAQSGISINTYPSTILIPSDSDGSNPVLTDAISTQVVRDGNVNTTSSYTFTIQAETNVTAVIQNGDEVKINAITADIGNVTVRASRSGYSDQDYEIPVQKQRKGSASLDATTVDGLTIKVNASDEGYVARDSDGEDSFFGSDLTDMVSLYNAPLTVPLDENEYIYRSSILRRAPSTNTNNGYSQLLRLYNIESIDSVSSFTVGNIVYGAENILEIHNDDGYDVDTTFATVNGTEGNVNFLSGLGDLTGYYVVGQKILVYVKISTEETKGVFYYITGTITSSTYTSITQVVFSTDFIYSDGISLNLNNAIVDGHSVRAVSYISFTPSTGVVGSNGNIIFGDKNLLRGAFNLIYGSNNSLNEAEDNIVHGSSWFIEPINSSYFGVNGNVLIGIGSDEGDDLKIIRGHRNLVVSSGDHNILSHEDTNANIVIGDYNKIGDLLNPQTTGYVWGVVIGTLHHSEATGAIMFGSGGHALTTGEIVFSSSSSPNQKSIFLLEGSTSSTSPYVLETVTRALFSAVRDESQSIQMANNTAFIGTVTLSSTIASGGTYMREERLQFSCDGSGNIINVLQESPANYTGIIGGGVSGTITYGTGSLNELLISVTPSSSTLTKWVCRVEGVVMDI